MAASFKRDEILADYRVGVRSREVSLLGRREVLTGKAKFGIFGDGKEVPQLAMARAARAGDFRAGYYRDQTFLLALDLLTVEAFFAQLYADPSAARDPASAGRQMNAHFATRMLDDEGRWLPQTDRVNVSADTSPTASQMPRLVGLAYASKLYRQLESLAGRSDVSHFSNNGDEVAFGTIGNASCAEGLFWEAINATGVLGGPLVMSIWDDDYGISVPNELQVTKGDLSALLSGFARKEDGDRASGQGYDLYTVRGWDYPILRQAYARAVERARSEHIPSILHVVELTQPQGHSTSGSHERYKTAERLAWEREHDGLVKMRAWILAEELADAAALDSIEGEEKAAVREAQQRAWNAFMAPIRAEKEELEALIATLSAGAPAARERLAAVSQGLGRLPNPVRKDLIEAARDALLAVHGQDNASSASASTGAGPARDALLEWLRARRAEGRERYSSHLTSASAERATAIEAIAPVYSDGDDGDGNDAPELNGFEILNRCFDAALARIPELLAFGEDLGRLGDVNQGFAGLQEKYGVLRVADTGIRECTIIGQAIGLALRGLRPIAEIQYLDYLLYALQILSDDLATLQYRTRGGQKAPVIVRTRGHRFEGIWHAGSPMAGILNLVRGIHLCVPRDMTRAAGMYNGLLASDDSAIVVEVLNGYRRKEKLPSNVGTFTVPLGVPETLREGDDLTVVTYGANCRIALEAATLLSELGIELEVIDVQTLLPFDREGAIARSLRRTNRLLVLDEDVPGGASAFILQQVLERQRGWWWLDGEPRTVTAQAHRPAYGSDGAYWSKPSVEDLFDAAYAMLHEADPKRHPAVFGW